ncbi:hypothetical protein BDP81DRAFT_389030 [Colletotrichum phormii]|uniref:Heterokaryon incompatibility domain-containing protein n=1 Tax=Colletotrichum phormii TaxID=359342 RepID=A0AAJ0ELD5_9PEZI|nr:uncharacterized protein BDP81DRAFT_389030 [Colletotrichum phormii]KAK1656206.1 hypothetical protein BDP81DRAFT_389030 [Colletotrichum phormii]
MQVIDYYQGWLLYSLIQEFLGGFLSTRTLHEDLATLRASGPLASIRPDDTYEKHLKECLDRAFEAFDEIEFRFPGFSAAFAEEFLCLASLAETLDSAVQTALIHGPVAEMDQRVQHFPESAKRSWFSKFASLLDLSSGDNKLAVIKAGWCPGDITKIGDSFNTIATFYYFSKFKADPTVADLHERCPEYGCGLRIPAEPKHMSEGCDCPGMVSFDEEDLIEIYQKGDVPCFCIGRLEEGSLGIALSSCSIDEESQKDSDNHYVALSHIGDIVRDPSKGVMDVAAQVYLSPYMRRMWTLQEAVLAGASRARGIGDRLCLSFADGILSLESIINLLKQAPRQEAVLAYRFMAEFRDLSTHMWQLGDDDDDKLVKHSLKGFDFFLNMLTVALKYRNVTVASDEVICPATLLNLRINSTKGVVPLIGHGETPEEGMCELWRRLQALGGSLPSDIIFSSIPRVQVPGYRWAPATVVQYAKHGDLYVSHSSAYPAKITDKGLHVRLPGARLTRPAATAGTLGRLLPKVLVNDGKQANTGDEAMPPSVFMAKLQTDEGGWFAVRIHHVDNETQESGSVHEGARSNTDHRPSLFRLLKSRSAALIYQNANISGPGLLVSIATPPSDLSSLDILSLNPEPLQTTSDFPVKIMPLSGGACVIAEAANTCVEELNRAVVAESRQRGGENAVNNVWENTAVITELFKQTAERIVEDSGTTLKEALYFEVLSSKASATYEAAIERFMQYVRQVASFGGGIRCEAYPEDQDWYVD